MSDNSSVRILCVFSRTDIGGAESFCMNVYRNIDRSKVQFDFVKHTEDSCDFDEEIECLGGHIFVAPRYKGYNRIVYRKWWKQHFLEHPEHKIVHGHYFTVAYEYLDVARKAGCYTIVHAHSAWVSTFFEIFLKRMVIRNADYCFACSKKSGEWLFPSRDFEIVHNGIWAEDYAFDREKRENKRRQLEIGDETLIVGTIANFSTVKNPFGLIDIFKELQKVKKDAVLLWVGYGYLKEPIEDYIRENGLTDKVILTGKQGNVAPYLQAMDVFLLPSFSEGLPVSLIEAQAAGLPCVCSDRITKEADVTGLCAFVDIENKDGWVDSILQASKIERRDTGYMIRKAGFDIAEVVEEMQNFYLRLADEKNRDKIRTTKNDYS